MTIPDQFQRRAQWQGNAIAHADAYLAAAELPSYSDVVTRLSMLVDTFDSADQSEEVAKSRAMVSRASGLGRLSKRQREYLAMKIATAFRRPSIFQAVEAITGKGKYHAEDIGPMHGRITVAPEHVEAVRAAVEPLRVFGQAIDVVGAPQ